MGSIARKVCTKCGKKKSLKDFHKNKNSKDGHALWCKDCKHLIRSIDYKNNKDKQKRNSVEWFKNHPNVKKAQSQRYYEIHKNYFLLYNRDWTSKNRDKVRQKIENYRARKFFGGGIITSEEWIALCEFYGNICLCCNKGDVKLTLDHVIPLSKGGEHKISNAQPLCKSCNSRKGAKTIDYRRNIR